MANTFIKIGHRGAKGYEPENTIQSIMKALYLKVDMVEIDVFKCASGEIVAMHDQKLQRTTSGTGYVTKKTLTELKQLDAGKGQKIPTLEEILDAINRSAKINIELKGKKTFGSVIKIIDHYVNEKEWAYNDFLVSSFTRSKLKKMAKLKPKFPIGVVAGRYTHGFLNFAKSLNAYSVNLNYKIVNKRLIKKAHQMNLKVFAWTVNDAAKINELKEIGIDGIFSDYPDRL